MTDEEWGKALAALAEMDRRRGTPCAFLNGTDFLYSDWLVALKPMFLDEMKRRGVA